MALSTPTQPTVNGNPFRHLPALAGKILAAEVSKLRATDAVLTRAMAIYHLAMVLANETLILHASQTTWLLYFGPPGPCPDPSA